MDSMKTLEVISSPETTRDLWDEMENDFNPSDLILKTVPSSTYRMRLLGPFVTTRRLYIPTVVKNNVSHEELTAIMDRKDTNVINNISARMDKLNVGKKWKKEATSFLQKSLVGSVGQMCVLSNALIKNDRSFELKVMPIVWTICDLLNAKGRNLRISGLNARDITIRKEYPQPTRARRITNASPLAVNTNYYTGIQYPINPAPLNTVATTTYSTGYYVTDPSIEYEQSSMPVYTVDVKEESFLTQNQIDYVMRRGLIDVLSLIKTINDTRSGNYIYRERSQYKMPSELNDVIFKDIAKLEENKHLDKVEEEILEVPTDAFEKAEKMRGSINCLEVE